jgi:hypothetical protein
MSAPVLAHGYPSPALVVGVGRLGLAVLERLGAEWALRSEPGDDTTAGNLRLLSVRPRDGAEKGALWRAREARVLRLAGRLGASDRASLALDFALLRSLGLVRYHQASYEVAVPTSGELYKFGGDFSPSGRLDETDEGVYRRRYFRWLPLGADPIAAVERLAVTREREVELELFVSPLLGRIRLGHVPRALVNTLLRMRAYAEGRDPGPWEWTARHAAKPGSPDQASAVCRVDAADLFAARNLARANSEDGAPGRADASRAPAAARRGRSGASRFEYVPAWALERHVTALDEHPQKSDEDRAWMGVLPSPVAPALADDAGSAVFVVPTPMLPDPEVMRLHGADPAAGLLVDAVWIAAYLGADWASTADGRGYRIFPTSLYRLGLYDHDATPSAAARRTAFSGRLRLLAGYVEQGFLRLWSDLERDPGVDAHQAVDGRGRDGTSESVLQSLAILGESLVRTAILDAPEPVVGDALPEDIAALPDVPSPALVRLSLPPDEGQDDVRHRLEARLAMLGHVAEVSDGQRERKLLASAVLEPADIEGSDADLADSPSETPALLVMRAHLNRAYRELYGDSFLRKYRLEGTKGVPRLTVVLVGDVSEPFVRATVRLVLREANAELRRTLGPIFSAERGGPQNYVSILPVLWAPHPPDASRDDVSTRARVLEEAAVHSCLHGLRRWIDAIPAGQRSIRQVFLNGRVTDNTVLDTRDVLDQTCSFLSLVLRNPLEDDPMLRQIHAPSSGTSGFATFACRELDFPERRARDYLALKFGIQALRHIQRPPQADRPPAAEFIHGPASAEDLSGPATQRLVEVTRQDGEAIADGVRRRAGEISRERAPSELAARFLPAYDAELKQTIVAAWRRMVRDSGGMDVLVERLRARVLEDARGKLGRLRRDTDGVVREQSVANGVQHAQVVLATLAAEAQRSLDGAGRELHEAEQACVANGVPSTDRLPAARQSLVDAIHRKPDWVAMQYGVLWFSLVGLLLGGPIFWSVSSAYDLSHDPGVIEAVLYQGGPGMAAALCGGLTFLALARFADIRTQGVVDACSAYAQAAFHTVAGDSAPSSVRSFLRARLALTTSVARRGHADQIFTQASVDVRHATRILRSASVQTATLRRRLEALGVRIALREGGDLEDVSRLFDARDGVAAAPLVEAASVQAFFDTNFASGVQWKGLAERLLNEAGHFERWREFAPLSETTQVIDVGRRYFRALIEVPIADYAGFGAEAVSQLDRFVKVYRGQLGFGADFDGLEGMDVDNNVFVQRCLAVVPPSLAARMDAAHREDPARFPRIERHAALVRANSAWLLSLANGLSSRVIRTLARYESPLERPMESPVSAFPYAMEFLTGSEPVSQLFGQVAGSLVRYPLAPLPAAPSVEGVGDLDSLVPVPAPTTLDVAPSPVLQQDVPLPAPSGEEPSVATSPGGPPTPDAEATTAAAEADPSLYSVPAPVTLLATEATPTEAETDSGDDGSLPTNDPSSPPRKRR